MKNRCWREEAIGWFDAMEKAIGRYLRHDFLRSFRRMLAEGTENELDGLRQKHEALSMRCVELASMRVDERPIDGDWAFPARYNAAFASICDLALEDFR